MLVLSRKVGESITIGDNIRIKVLDVKGNQLRLGIEAPADMRIYREEIYRLVQEQNRQAASWDMTQLQAALQVINGQGVQP